MKKCQMKKFFSMFMAATLAVSALTVTACEGATDSESTSSSSTVDSTDSFEISQTELKMLIGSEEYLTCTGGADVIWTSSNPEIVTVDQNGILFGKAEGTVRITATSGGFEQSCEVTVVKSFTEVNYLSFESQYVDSAYVGLEFPLKGYLVLDNQPVNEAVVNYTSSNSAVISITDTTATVLSVGECVLTASCTHNGVTYEQNLYFTAIDEYAAIVFEGISGSRMAMMLEQELMIDCRVFVNGVETEVEVEWSSTAPQVVSVENGKCTAVGKGEAMIKATYKNAEKILHINSYENYLHKFVDEESKSGFRGTKTSWGSSVTPKLEMVTGETEGRTPDKGAFLKVSWTEDAPIYSNGITLTNVIDVETMKMLYAFGATEVVIPVWVSCRTEISAFDGSTTRGNKVAEGGEWTEIVYNMKDFVSWCELNNGNFNQSQDRPFMFLITNATEFTMYVDSIYIR